MNIQTTQLETLKNNKTLVNFYADGFGDAFFGYIISFNDEFLLLEKFSDIGESDGIMVCKRENLTRIRWGGNNGETTARFTIYELRISNIDHIQIGSIYDILRSVHAMFGYVNIYMENIQNDACYIGEIVDMDDEILILKEFGTYTSLDRSMLMVNIEEITKVEAGGKYESNLRELFKKAK